MSHLDEGTLHALLDGELEMTEVKEIQAHLGSCTACGTRLRQVKEFYAEADRLVAALEVPGSAPAPGMSRSVGGEAPARAERAAAPAVRPPPPIEGQPIFLIPDNPDWAERARRFMAPMKWAAVLLVAVSAGFIASEVKRGPRVTSADSDLEPAVAESTTAPVLSAEEATTRPDSGALAGAAAAAPPPAAMAKSKPAPTPVPTPPAAPAPARQRALTAAKSTPAAVVDSARETKDQAVGLADRTARQNDRQTTAGRAAAPAPAAEPPSDNVRSEAARALEELDRERRVARAAAATAALDSARRDSIRRSEFPRQQPRAAVAAAPAPATPPQRTLEQRADTYMRIGLDEAARQLGRPVHVIEGLSPLFMGLAQGRTSPGADTSRPVVRVVYQDAQGRLILLDQQHLRPGQDTTAPKPGEPHWTLGEILLHLHGEIGPEVLRNMRARVR